MAQGCEDLTAEIDRIVNSAYPTQLKALRDILCMGCTESDILRWSLARPCQIERLACCVLDGLRQWPYVLDIVEKLSFEVQSRDAFLRREPGLLHDIVSHAIRIPGTGSTYTAAAIAILSHPLPDGVPIPSNVQTLFIRLFDFAAEQPSIASIKPIYRLVVQGTSTLLLGLLSSSVLFRFEEHLFNILRSIKGDNQSLSLYCLAIMKTMSEMPESRLGSFGSDLCDTQELLASTQVTGSSRWTPDAISQFFTGSKAQKTMQLVVLRAMWACTRTTGDSHDERSESLVLANEIITAVALEPREVWRKANALVVRKLEEKISAPALEPELRFRALCFLMRITEGSLCPLTAMDSLRQHFLNPGTISLALADERGVSFRCLMDRGVFDESTTTALLQNTVDFLTSASAQELVESSSSLLRLLKHMSPAMAYSEFVIDGAMMALDVLSCGRKLQCLEKLTKQSLETFDERLADVCNTALRAMHQSLVHEICKIFLTAALSSRQSTYSVAQETMSLLLDLHASSAHGHSTCRHIQRRPITAHRELAFIEAESTPSAGRIDWRDTLDHHLQSRARSEQESLGLLFTGACAELEARCVNIERPLREETERRSALEQQHEELNEAYRKLEADEVDRSISSNALQMERDQCISDLETARDAMERLEQQVEKLEQAVRNAETESENNLAKVRRAQGAAELEHAAALAKKEEECDELQEQLCASTQKLKDKSVEMDGLVGRLENAQSAVEITKKQLEQVEEARSERETYIVQLKDQKDEVLKHEEQLEAQLHSIRDEMHAIQEAYQLETKHLKNKADDDIAAAERSSEQKFADVTRWHEEVKEALEKQLRDLIDESVRTSERHGVETEKRDADVAEKQKQIDKLHRNCEQKDKQIAEANAMRTNLMVAMGLDGGLQYRTNLPHRPSRSSTQTQRKDLDSQADPSPPTPFSADDAEAQQLGNGGSFASNVSSTESRSGPTPKRARARRTFKVPSPAQPRLSTNFNPRTTRTSIAGHSTMKRQPLSSVGANMKGNAPKTPSKGASLPPENELDASTFEGSELFAGTPGERMLDLPGMLDENYENSF